MTAVTLRTLPGASPHSTFSIGQHLFSLRHQGAAYMSSPTTANITIILKESRTFPPPAAFAAQAHVKSVAEYERLFRQAEADPEGFWAEQAKSLTWARPFTKVLEWNEPFAKWFVGGQLNVSANC